MRSGEGALPREKEFDTWLRDRRTGLLLSLASMRPEQMRIVQEGLDKENLLRAAWDADAAGVRRPVARCPDNGGDSTQLVEVWWGLEPTRLVESVAASFGVFLGHQRVQDPANAALGAIQQKYFHVARADVRYA